MQDIHRDVPMAPTKMNNYENVWPSSMFRYLRRVHIQHYVSSNVSSGLATLPLSFVYINDTVDKSRPTNKSLPTGESLDGKKSSEKIVTYFTTNSITPDEIHQLGYKMLNELYPQVSGDTLTLFLPK